MEFFFFRAGGQLIILLLFDSYAFYGIDRNVERKRLKNLSGSLEHNLHREVVLLLKQMQVFNKHAAIALNDSLKFNNYWQNVSPTSYNYTSHRLNRINKDYFPNVQRVFWTDTAGMMTESWDANSSRYANNAKVKVDTRNYFKIINNGGGWSLGTDPTKFVLESITSYTNGEKYAVISARSDSATKSEKYPIIALATNLVSLYKPILPPGYGFCVIDKAGKVLFHQNDNLNLNENLLEETNFDPRLKAALYSQAPAHFFQNYQGNRHQLYVRPVRDMPFFLVTYVNEAFHKGFNVNLLVLTSLFLSLYLFSLALLSGLIILCNKGFSGILFKWLWPKKNNNRLYAKIILALAGTILITLWHTDTTYQITSFFLFLYAALYILIFIHNTLNGIPFQKTNLSSLVIILALNGICLATDVNAFIRTGLFQGVLLFLFFGVNKLFEEFWQNKNLIKWCNKTRKRARCCFIKMIT